MTKARDHEDADSHDHDHAHEDADSHDHDHAHEDADSHHDHAHGDADSHHDHAHEDADSHDHDHAHGDADSHHDHAHDYRGTSRRSLIIALTLIVGYMMAEVVGGIMSGSLALISDAGHMLTDASAIGLALLAMWIAGREVSVDRTFGYHRAEILATMLNTLGLWLIVGWMFLEAYNRFGDVPDVNGTILLTVGTGGLVINLIAAWVLHRSAQHSLNVEGAFRHVMADLMGSVGVVVSGILVLAFGWTIADPILSVVIGVLILVSSWRLVAKTFHVLLEGTPEHIDVYELCSNMEDLEGVTLIHDVHVWTVSSGYEIFMAHVLVDPDYSGDLDLLLRRLRQIASRDFDIDHVTIQMEQSLADCSENHHLGHLLARSRSTI